MAIATRKRNDRPSNHVYKGELGEVARLQKKKKWDELAKPKKIKSSFW